MRTSSDVLLSTAKSPRRLSLSRSKRHSSIVRRHWSDPTYGRRVAAVALKACRRYPARALLNEHRGPRHVPLYPQKQTSDLGVNLIGDFVAARNPGTDSAAINVAYN